MHLILKHLISLVLYFNRRKWACGSSEWTKSKAFFPRLSALQGVFRSERRQNLPYHGNIRRYLQRSPRWIVSLFFEWMRMCGVSASHHNIGSIWTMYVLLLLNWSQSEWLKAQFFFSFTFRGFSWLFCPKQLTVIHTYIHTPMAVAAMQGAVQQGSSFGFSILHDAGFTPEPQPPSMLKTTQRPNVFFPLLSSGFSMYSERKPGLNTGPQKQSVRLTYTNLLVPAWRRSSSMHWLDVNYNNR